MQEAEVLKIFNALSNKIRWQILEWLKKPRRHFSDGISIIEGQDIDKIGVSVGLIQHKAGISQSTASQYLSLMQEAGLIQAERIGQWTYYTRNESQINKFIKYMKRHLKNERLANSE